VTTGDGILYRDPNNLSDRNAHYTDKFGGTSSASAIVAGVAANLQSIALRNLGHPIPPLELRDLLVSTGTPQAGDLSQHIGPRPDLRLAVRTLLDLECPSDCDHSGQISVDEVITSTLIALGQSSLAVCPAADENLSLEVTVDELTTAIQSALLGCPPK
jgi:hypothetical protein